MRVYAVAEKSASGMYRIRQPVAALKDDIDVTILEEGLPVVFNRSTREFVSCDLDCDVLVIMRPMYWFVPDVIRYVQSRGTKVVVDIDDDFTAIHGLNKEFLRSHPKTSPESNTHYLRTCCRLADLVTVSTDALAARYGMHGQTCVLRNYVDDHWLQIDRRENSPLVVGWSGSLSHHLTDAPVTHGGVGAALNATGATFLSIGGEKDIERVQSIFGLRDRPNATSWVDFDLYPYLLARMDIGIVPLANIAFNWAKSWLKGIEYSALSIPFVASPTPEYVRLHNEYGLGDLAQGRARDWKASVRRLINDDGYRRDQSWHARDVVASYLTISRNAHRWAEAWESVLTKEKVMT